MEEKWKDIEEYEGLYQISSLGYVRRLATTSKKKAKKIKATDNGNGYMIVGLCKGGIRKQYYIHRLVAKAFINNIKNYTEINHKDNNKSNNNVENLEWCTRSYNVQYSYDKGYHVAPKSMLGRKGKNHPISKTVKQFDLERNLIKEYESANIASQETGICYGSIKKCRCGRQKTAGGYIWTY